MILRLSANISDGVTKILCLIPQNSRFTTRYGSDKVNITLSRNGGQVSVGLQVRRRIYDQGGLKMKKALSMLLVLCMVISLAACGEDKKETTAVPVGTTQSGNETQATQATQKALDFPTKNIELWCASAAGSTADMGCRAVAQKLEEILGVNVVVQNKSGSGNWTCYIEYLNSVPRDGYTIVQTTTNILFGEYREDNPVDKNLDDFILMVNQQYDPYGVAIRKDETRFTDYNSLIEYAKTNELLVAVNNVSITSGEPTAVKHMIKEFGCKMTLVPADSTSNEKAMLYAGDVDVFVNNVSSIVGDDQMKPLVVYDSKRSEYLPDVPTAKELGDDFALSFSRGYGYAAGVDQEIVDFMTEALKKAISDPDVLAQMDKIGAPTNMLYGQEYYDLLLGDLDVRLDIWGVEKKH